ncbi:SPOR domain-containing protein [Agarilytica rhodophyticola]|uniref:SPOR domain-containing protein n=1 Tax=Agarilytica rhodophyticola TaxID=1737490 RepID=UPI0013157738|nr:AAA family ATPase [Agarilytica rhodophyticola]
MTSAPETNSAQISDSHEYFSTPSLKGLVQQLSHLAFFGDGLSLVLGAKGSGKTALCSELTQNLSQADDTIAITLDADFELAECMAEILTALGLQGSDSLSVGEMLAELRHFVQALAQDKKLVTLIIDDAHFLDDQAIGALISLMQGRTEANVGLHLILLSKPGLDQRIDALQIIDVPVYDFDMPNLSPSELSRFFEHLRPQLEPLESPQLQKIWASSHGMPGPALALLDELDSGEVKDQADDFVNKNSAIPYAHIAAIVLLGLALIWSLLLTNDDGDKQISTPIAPAKAINGDLDQQTKQLYQKSQVPTLEPKPSKIDNLAQALPESEAVQVATGQQQKDQGSGTIQGSPAIDNTEPALTVTELDEAKTRYRLPPKTTELKTPDSAPSRPEVISPPTIKPLAKKQEKVASDLTISEAYLMQQNPNAYTLQVIAASGKAALEAYIERQSNRKTLHMYRGVSKRKNWFVVVQGVYSSREEALKGIKSLPSEQSKAGPWPRKISAIQQEIETFRRK